MVGGKAGGSRHRGGQVRVGQVEEATGGLGGQTGDCLGAAVYGVQLVVLLAVTAG